MHHQTRLFCPLTSDLIPISHLHASNLIELNRVFFFEGERINYEAVVKVCVNEKFQKLNSCTHSQLNEVR